MWVVLVFEWPGPCFAVEFVAEEERGWKSNQLKTLIHAKQFQYPQIKCNQNAGKIWEIGIGVEESELPTEGNELIGEEVKGRGLHQRHNNQKWINSLIENKINWTTIQHN